MVSVAPGRFQFSLKSLRSAVVQKGAFFLADPKLIVSVFNSLPAGRRKRKKPAGFFCLSLGEPLYESCSKKVAKMLYKKVHKTEEVKDLDFYTFSYYYDRAAEVGLIGTFAFVFISF